MDEASTPVFFYPDEVTIVTQHSAPKSTSVDLFSFEVREISQSDGTSQLLSWDDFSF